MITRRPPAPVEEVGPAVLVVRGSDSASTQQLVAGGYELVIVNGVAETLDALMRRTYVSLLIDEDVTELPVSDLVSIARTYQRGLTIVLISRSLGERPQGVDARVLGVLDRAGIARALAAGKAASTGAVSTPPPSADEMRERFARALERLSVAFAPVVCADGATAFGFEARVRSLEPRLTEASDLRSVARSLGKTEDLGRRIRSLSAAVFSGAPEDAHLFIELPQADLLDASLFDGNSALASMADRVVLALVDPSNPVGDAGARMSVLRFQGFRFATTVEQARTRPELEPEFVKIDIAPMRGVHPSIVRRRLEDTFEICRSRGGRALATGVATMSELEMLRGLGCQLFQGELFESPDAPKGAAGAKKMRARLA